MCLNTGIPQKTLIFHFETNGKLMALGVPILKHFRVHSKKKLRYCDVDKWTLLRWISPEVICLHAMSSRPSCS